ncbi:hypothetical protein [Chitinibacter sp. ZOR0017]|uniref:hypothetical protein n=1 Tax=Chitinibacter sp. ZOR0017 TaxID=1339254 RepID=UPI0009E06898|nr:hypothetical protein [Chitinibacter sp. ZOR0017]
MADISVSCTRCRNKHLESERIQVPAKNGMSHLVCPRCKCRSYFDLTPFSAWCFASGLIEFGLEEDKPDGAIIIARGEKSSIKAVVDCLARHGKGESAGKLLVPGVPEAVDQHSGMDALIDWLKWCAKGNGHKGRFGVEFCSGV